MGSFVTAAVSIYSAIKSNSAQKKQAKYQRQQVEASNRAEVQRNRFNKLQQKRARVSAARKARVQQGKITGSMGGTLGISGTSSYVGSIGSIGTQTSANIGNINVAEGYGDEVSRLNIQAANFGSQANTAASKAMQWQNIGSMAGTIGSIFNTAGSSGSSTGS